MLILGMNAHFWYKIALPMGVTLHPRGEHALSMGVDTLRACSPRGCKFEVRRQLLYLCLHPRGEHALPVGVKILKI